MSSDGVEPRFANYYRLVNEYRASVASCIAGLKKLRAQQQELRELASELRLAGDHLNGVHQVEKALGKITGNNGLPGIDGLSVRELEVLSLLGQGLSSHEIATQLGVATSTVETYRERLKDKLDLATGAALTRYAIIWSLSHTNSNSMPEGSG